MASDYMENTAAPDERRLMFDDYMTRAKNQPDDTEVQQSIVAFIQEEFDAGRVDNVLSYSMQLAAEACLHSHLEETANQAGTIVDSLNRHGQDDGHGHGGKANHQSVSTRSGRKSRAEKKKASLSSSWYALFSKYFKTQVAQ